ncbi:uncharacterized protein LOC103041317 isoform X1 [Astyanax mexicanus]|uniref:uncharacterized protein LOC103041317 isoform X1 n=1 Tax=Astyanax mexicanus TaxID=7994 RepID=UPI0020CAAC53|nr:uncharacterized protein LOC103041317 isoform X1 [Astyanax mexicanus]
MAVLLRVLLFAALIFLSSSEVPSDSTKLKEVFQKGIDLAVQQVNSHTGLQNHFLFFKTVEQSSIESGFGVIYIYQHFYLKPTKCSRGTENADPKTCAFRNDREQLKSSGVFKVEEKTIESSYFSSDCPLIDCAICYKTHAWEIEKDPKPYVHCVHKPALTEEMKKGRVEHCQKGVYGSGTATLLTSIGKP